MPSPTSWITQRWLGGRAPMPFEPSANPEPTRGAQPVGAAKAASFGLGLVALLLSAAAGAQSAAALYKDADLPLGEKLMRDLRCVECHVRKVGGDGSSMYRPQGRINTPGLLRGMVEMCNTELSLSLFPEEVTAISAVLNRDHYRFK